MIALSQSEAMLFRMLAGFFGKDRIVYRLSLMAVCGGELPSQEEAFGAAVIQEDLALWAKHNKCLFTVTDDDDNPKLVVEFYSQDKIDIDVEQVEHQRIMKPLLEAKGVHYITFNDSEFSEITRPDSRLDFFHLLKAKVEQVGVYTDSSGS